MTQECRILFLEDSERDVAMMSRVLSVNGLRFSSVRVDTEERFLEQLETFDPTLIIGDYSLPKYDGISAVTALRRRQSMIPYILVSGSIGEERATEALKKGATDFLVKSSITHRLAAMVERAIRDAEAASERRRIDEMLRRSQKLEALGHLAGGIAHDFNNILAIVIGNIDMMLSRLSSTDKLQLPESDELTVLARSALDGSLNGARLIKQILAFSRTSSGTIETTDLKAILTSTSEMIQRTLAANISFVSDVPTETWFVQADGAQIMSCVLNVAANARDAIPNGGDMTLTVRNEVVDRTIVSGRSAVPPGEYVLVTVADTGKGMTPQVLEQMLEPYFTTKDVGKGTGLGMAMVEGFLRQMGGHLSVDSHPGQGTVVRLYLPRAAEGDLPRPATTALTQAVPRGHGECILIVEDEAAVRKVVALQLERLGYSIVEAESAAAALELLNAGETVDLVLSDVQLPGGMNGVELSAELARSFPDVGVILTSGYLENVVESDTGSVDDRGIEGVLRKPYRQKELAMRIRGALSARNLELQLSREL